MASIHNCNVINLQKINNRKGNITSVQPEKDISFSIKRIYYLYDVPGGEQRGGHAHYKLRQLIVAVSGSFDIILDDGLNKKKVHLNRPDFGLLISPGIWREMINFSSGAVVLVLASEIYDEIDYIRDYTNFLKFCNVNNGV